MTTAAPLRTAGTAILLGALAFAVTVEWRAQGAAREEIAGRRAEMATVIAARQRRAADLEGRLAALREEVARAAERDGGATLRSLQEATDDVASLSGTAAIAGPGVTVVLADAPDAGRTAGESDTRIQDLDVQAVVNELWAAGAEAIAVNGQRLVATSAIRNAGAAVLVNYRVLTSPYRVEAVGNPERMRDRFTASPVARRFRNWSEIYGLGFRVEESKSLALPPFRGSVRFRYAHPVGQQSVEEETK